MDGVGVHRDSCPRTDSHLLWAGVPASYSNNECYNYLLAVKPDLQTINKINAVMREFYDQFLPRQSRKESPLIMIASFRARETMEDTLTRWMQRICSRMKSFPVTLHNYGGFPPQTIYLRVPDKEPFDQLAKHLVVIDDYLAGNQYPAIEWIGSPRLSIAGLLPDPIYQKAIGEYAQQSFYESFTATELLLLRQTNVSEPCRLVNVFGLLPNENNLFN